MVDPSPPTFQVESPLGSLDISTLYISAIMQVRMGVRRYSDGFKVHAAKQVVEQGAIGARRGWVWVSNRCARGSGAVQMGSNDGQLG